MSQIALLTTSFPQFEEDPSGHFVLADAESRAALGHDVLVLCPGTPNPWTDQARSIGRGHLEISRLGASQLFGPPGALPNLQKRPGLGVEALVFIARARRELSRGAFDLVVAHWLIPCAWPLGVNSRYPVEMVAHGSDVRLLANLPKFLRNRITKQLLEHKLTLVGSHLRQQLASSVDHDLRSQVERCEVVPSPISVPYRSRTEARRRLKLGASPIAVYVGRLIESKRVHVALRFPLAPDYHQVVIGDGPLRQSLSNTFPRATFLGALPRDQTLDWIAAANVLISASVLEGAPTTIREALALGTEVFAAPAADLRVWSREAPGLKLVEALGKD